MVSENRFGLTKKLLFGICIISIILCFLYMKGNFYDPVHPFVGGKFMPPSSQFLLGTDHLGRDVFSRLMFATCITVVFCFCAVTIALLFGTILGLIAGYNILKGFTPVIITFGKIFTILPVRWLPLIVVAFFGKGMLGMIVSMSLTLWSHFFWIIYDETINLKGKQFVKSAVLLGGTKWSIVKRHFIPHIIPITLVLGTFSFRTAIGVISTLSFLGVGIQPPTPTWGLMIAEGHPYLLQAWWIVLFPTAAVCVSVLLVNALGNRLEAYFNRRKGEIVDEGMRGDIGS